MEAERKRKIAAESLQALADKRRKHPKKFPCHLCEKAYTAQQVLNRHLKNFHAVEP